VSIYVVLIGVASFLEEPVARSVRAFQMNLLIRVGSFAAALAAFGIIDRAAFPPMPWLLAGLGVGLISGVGSICYCLSLDSLPVTQVVTLANLYLVVTVVLGMVVLHEPASLLTIGGLTCTFASMLMLVRPPGKYGVHSSATWRKAPGLRAYGVMGLYIVLIGVGTFLEKPLLSTMDATQFNALQAIAMTAVAGIAVAVTGPHPPRTTRTVQGIGLGALIGLASVSYFVGLRGLPVSVAAAFSNASMVVTVLLAAIVLKRRMSPMQIGAVLLMLVGLTLLAM
jgi:drug/metabolite transporter (DMT)-like permease